MAKKSRKQAKSRSHISRKRSPAPPRTPPLSDPLDALIETTGRALGIKIDPAWMPAIRANLQVTFRLGAMVTTLALADDTEPGPVFRS